MPLLINNDVQERLLDHSDAIDAIESAFCQLGSGDAIFEPRRVDFLSPTAEQTHADDAFYQWASLRGAIRDPPRMGFRFRSDIMYTEEYEGTTVRQKYNGQPGTYMGFVLLIDTTNGELLALLNDGILQHVRVGATAGVASKYLAVEDADSVAMIGSGGMAETHAAAFDAIHDLSEIRVYSPTKENREQFARDESEKLNANVRAVDSGREAVRDADIVAACTNAYEPVLETEWLEPGMFLTNVTPNEIADKTIEYADRVTTTTNHGAFTPQAIGDDELYNHFMSVQGERDYIDLNLDTLPEIVAGTKPSRQSNDAIIHYENRSCGIQFPAIAQVFYSAANERGLGTQLPLDWFQQAIRD